MKNFEASDFFFGYRSRFCLKVSHLNSFGHFKSCVANLNWIRQKKKKKMNCGEKKSQLNRWRSHSWMNLLLLNFAPHHRTTQNAANPLPRARSSCVEMCSLKYYWIIFLFFKSIFVFGSAPSPSPRNILKEKFPSACPHLKHFICISLEVASWISLLALSRRRKTSVI